MKLAEALLERKSLKQKMEELKKRAYQNAQVQEGEEPVESPLVLLSELENTVENFTVLVTRINHTNNQKCLEAAKGISMMEALCQRDMLKYRTFVYTNLADKASSLATRYSQREIKMVPTVEVGKLRKKADAFAKQARQLDAIIQEANWTTDLI
jgi:hypothetical protein